MKKKDRIKILEEDIDFLDSDLSAAYQEIELLRKHLGIAERELKRKEVIISYLESKLGEFWAEA